MKTTIGFSFTILCFALVFITIITIEVNGRTITVDDDGGADHKEIQDAIDNAEDGDTIYLREGTYGEGISEKSLYFEGENRNETNIETLILAEKGNNWIHNLSFKLVYIDENCNNNKISNCSFMNIEKNDPMVVLDSTNHNIIEYCTFHQGSSTAGISISRSSNNLVNHCSFDRNSITMEGDSLEEYHSNDVSNCVVNGRELVFLKDITAHTINQRKGQIILINCSDVEINSQEISNIDIGIQIIASERIALYKCNISSNKRTGIHIEGSNNCSIIDTTIFGNGIGIFITESHNNLIESCEILNNNRGDFGNGIFLKYSCANEIKNCVVSFHNSSNNYAIRFGWNSNNNSIQFCEISKNMGKAAIEFFSESDGNEVIDCLISENHIAISCRVNSRENEISSCNIVDNIKYGIQVTDNSNNNVTAINDWWGDVTGPYHSSRNPDGIGDNITDNVDFDPWFEEEKNWAPIAIIESMYPNPVLDGDKIHLIGSGFDTNEIIRYVWRSSIDGEFYNGTETMIEHDSLSNGTHSILFKVQDINELWSPEVSIQLIVNGKPTAYIDSIVPNPLIASQTLSLSGHGMDDGTIQRYVWRTNDTELHNDTTSDYSTTEFAVGTYWIYFRVQDDFEIWSDEVYLTLIVNQLPEANFTLQAWVSLQIGDLQWKTYLNERITFNASASIGDVSFDWDFGDGTALSMAPPVLSHEYAATGSYDVNLTVHDDYGNSDKILGRIDVVDRPEAILGVRDAATGEPLGPEYVVLVGQEIILDASGSKGDLNTFVFGYDLQNAFLPQILLGTSMYQHVYSESEVYKVGLKVVDDLGNMSQMEVQDFIPITVHERPSAIITSISPNPAMETVTISFIANGTDDGEIARYLWKEGETELFNGTDTEFFKSDLTPGVHTISMRVQDNYGVWSEEVTQDLEIMADADGDGIADNDDAFPDDPSASKDTDGDRYPDEWNKGKTEKDSTTGLKLDQYPSDSKKWEKDDDGGGIADSWWIILMILGVTGAAVILGFVKRRKAPASNTDQRQQPPQQPPQ